MPSAMSPKLLFLLLLALFSPAFAAEPPGSWLPPDPDGRPWKHAETGLSFPVILGTHRLAGEFRYREGGGRFIRYESLEERSRGDIFFFPAGTKDITMEEKQRLILQEMDNVLKDLEAMSKEGRYKELVIGEVGVGGIDLWEKESLPLAARACEMTRTAQTQDGVEQARIVQWTGVTFLDGWLITIRQMRPVTPDDDGSKGLQAFAQLVTKVIKDPPLRRGVARMIDRYMENPLSEESVQATAAVLAYLKGTSDLPISIPEHPVQEWLEHCQKVVPGTEQTLLSAFMLGSAKSALAGGDVRSCLNSGARQFARIYRELLAKHPAIALPKIDEFLAAAMDDKGGEWLLRYSGSGS